ncbi:MAG: hypothetical protein ACKO6K_08095 [Chitinophagaceae bacterium]
MLSAEERRFLRSWEEQRKGGKWSYYLLYILGGTVVLTVGVAFLLSIIPFQLPSTLWIIPVISAGLAVLLTVFSWKKNERRFKQLLRREIQQGQRNNSSQ